MELFVSLELKITIENQIIYLIGVVGMEPKILWASLCPVYPWILLGTKNPNY